MDDVQCRGDEASLSECNFSGWGEHDCRLEEVKKYDMRKLNY